MGTGIIGREAELTEVSHFLRAVPEGPAALLLEGDPGIGKTTLWQEGVRSAASFTFRVLSARPSPAETKLAFSALTDLLAPVADEVLPAIPVPQRRALEVALLRETRGRRSADHRALCTGLVSAISVLSSSRPVVVAVDDAQWLDRSSYRVLEFCVRRLAGRPTGILASVRTIGEPGVPLGLDKAVSEARLRRVRLGPLSLGALHQLMKAKLGRTFPRPTLLHIVRVSGGNPFFALEIARALPHSGGHVDLGALPVPETLRELVAGRIDVLSAPARRVLLVASVSTAALATAQEARVIQVKGGRIRFTHPLLAISVYSSASPGQRRSVHRKLAALVVDEEEHARHLAHAASEPNSEVAAALDEAGGKAGSRGAPDAAAELFEQAARLTPNGRDEDRWRRTIRAAVSAFRAGESRWARELLDETIAAAPTGPLRAEALVCLSMIRYHDDSPVAGIRLLEQALEQPGTNARLRAEIQSGLSWASHWAGDIPRSSVHARAALQLLEPLGDPPPLAASLALVVLVNFLMGQAIHWDTLNRAVQLEDPREHRPVEQRPGAIKAFILKTTDDLAAARALFQTVYRTTKKHGDEASLPFLLFHMSETESLAGDYVTAVRYADEGLDIATRNELEVMRGANLYARALADTYAGRADAARAAGEEAMAISVRTGMMPLTHQVASVLGFNELSLGDAAAAHDRLAPVAQLVVAAGVREPGLLRFVPDEVEALVTLGEVEQASSLLDPFEKQGHALGRRGALAAAARCRGVLAAARGDLAEAETVLHRAVEMYRALPYPFDLARTLLLMGQIHRRRKEKRAARDALEQSLRGFQRLGSPLWAERARGELDRVVGRRRAGAFDLTPTEQRVAELAASGLTNREVAKALFVSPKTVEANLARAYRKLGIRSRAELGAKMAGRANQDRPKDPPDLT